MSQVAFRRLAEHQRSELTLIDRAGGRRQVIHETRALIEAPNWTPDGRWLVFNSDGRLFRIAVDGSGGPTPIDTGTVDDINNDHVLSPDGRTIFFSAAGHLYAVPFEGGTPRRISNLHPAGAPLTYYLHGVSPDGLSLAYVGLDGANRSAIYRIPAAGGPDTRLSFGELPVDGPEYSPDGRWIYFNAELRADEPGHAQIVRMPVDASTIEVLTHDARVNWFPHLSPDGHWLAYLSYPEGTRGHPADLPVVLRCMPAAGGPSSDVVALFGGQGTLNVNSWAPDSRRFAYVAYPLAAH